MSKPKPPPPYRWSTTMDRHAHEFSYARFLAIIKWSLVVIAAVLLLLLMIFI